MLEVSRYIHINPVEARMVKLPKVVTGTVPLVRRLKDT
jgi:hypothetical protein